MGKLWNQKFSVNSKNDGSICSKVPLMKLKWNFVISLWMFVQHGRINAEKKHLVEIK